MENRKELRFSFLRAVQNLSHQSGAPIVSVSFDLLESILIHQEDNASHSVVYDGFVSTRTPERSASDDSISQVKGKLLGRNFQIFLQSYMHWQRIETIQNHDRMLVRINSILISACGISDIAEAGLV